MRITSYNKFKLTFLLVLLIAVQSVMAQKKCLVISVDGLTPFAIPSCHTPNIDALINNGTYSLEGQTLAPTYDAPGWTSLLTGVWYTKHGVTTENMDVYDPSVTPDLFTIIKQVNASLSTAAFLKSDSIATYLAINADVVGVYDTDEKVIEEAVSSLGGVDVANFTLVQLDTVNNAGYGLGYDKTVSEYILALQHADAMVGELVNAIHSRSTFNDEEWMIILTSNHGGTPDGNYGGSSAEEKAIPVIISGDDVPNGEVVAKEGQDNAIQLLNYRPGNPAGSYGGILGRIDDDIFDLPELTIELELKQTFLRGGWQTIFDINNDGTLLALQGDILKTYGRCGTNTVSEDFKFSIGVNYHIAFTIKGPTWKVYINGELIGQGETCGEMIDGHGIGFGGGLYYYHLPLRGDSENFLGVFNEIRIWNVALPADIIAEYSGARNIEQSEHPYIASGNMVLYWKMDEVDGQKIEDFSGNGNDGEVDYWKDGADPERLEYKHVPAAGFQLIDITPSVLSYLGIELKPEWEIDGIPFEVKKVILGPQNDDWNVIAAKHYPNPTVSQLNVVIPDEMDGDVVFTVANSTGMVMNQKLVSGCETILNVNGYKPGIYFYSLKDGKNVVLGKFIVR